MHAESTEQLQIMGQKLLNCELRRKKLEDQVNELRNRLQHKKVPIGKLLFGIYSSIELVLVCLLGIGTRGLVVRAVTTLI